MTRTARTRSHPSVFTYSSATIQRQFTYAQSAAGLQTARNVIAEKIRNCRGLLTNYRQSRVRSGDATRDLIDDAQHQLRELCGTARVASDQRQLFVIEARAAIIYWGVLRVLCHQPQAWRRTYPVASDALNRLLNMGYGLLAKNARTALAHAGLLPQIGILHGQTSQFPLAHDFVEPFRQPLVDRLLLPAFTRKRREVIRLPKQNAARALAALHAEYHTPWPYGTRCLQLRYILQREGARLRNAIQNGEPYKPYRYRWRHQRVC